LDLGQTPVLSIIGFLAVVYSVNTASLSCNNALGHDVQAMQSTAFKVLLARGLDWAATSEAHHPVPRELKEEK
jgi:hypothetical protein